MKLFNNRILQSRVLKTEILEIENEKDIPNGIEITSNKKTIKSIRKSIRRVKMKLYNTKYRDNITKLLPPILPSSSSSSSFFSSSSSSPIPSPPISPSSSIPTKWYKITGIISNEYYV